MEILTFKGYKGSIETSLKDGILYGKVLFIADLVTYEAESLTGLKTAFEEAVIDYLETCKSVGKTPEKPAGGIFNVRAGAERHQKAILRAMTDNVTLNSVVNSALDLYLENVPVVQNHHHKHEHLVNVKLVEEKAATATATSSSEYNYFKMGTNDVVQQH